MKNSKRQIIFSVVIAVIAILLSSSLCLAYRAATFRGTITVQVPPSPQNTVAEPSPSWSTELYDSFESGEWNGLWVEDKQNDWSRSALRAKDGLYSAVVRGRAQDSTLTLAKAINLGGKSYAQLMFSWYIEKTIDLKEYVAVDVSIDKGKTWKQLGALAGDVDKEDTWHDVVINLDKKYMVSELKIRFRANMSLTNEGASVDEVKLVAK